MSLAAAGALLATFAPLSIPGHPSVRPWPIGPGPRYRPPAAFAVVTNGRPLGRLRCGPPGADFALHLEIFVDRKVVVIPAGIGVARPSSQLGAAVVARGCVYPVSTLEPTGVVEVARGARLRLADLFRIWGQRLGARRIGSFVSRSAARAYVGGKPVSGPLSAIPLSRHAEIVLELGAYVAPHPFFLFAEGER